MCRLNYWGFVVLAVVIGIAVPTTSRPSGESVESTVATVITESQIDSDGNPGVTEPSVPSDEGNPSGGVKSQEQEISQNNSTTVAPPTTATASTMSSGNSTLPVSEEGTEESVFKDSTLDESVEDYGYDSIVPKFHGVGELPASDSESSTDATADAASSSAPNLSEDPNVGNQAGEGGAGLDATTDQAASPSGTNVDAEESQPESAAGASATSEVPTNDDDANFSPTPVISGSSTLQTPTETDEDDIQAIEATTEPLTSTPEPADPQEDPKTWVSKTATEPSPAPQSTTKSDVTEQDATTIKSTGPATGAETIADCSAADSQGELICPEGSYSGKPSRQETTVTGTPLAGSQETTKTVETATAAVPTAISPTSALDFTIQENPSPATSAVTVPTLKTPTVSGTCNSSTVGVSPESSSTQRQVQEDASTNPTAKTMLKDDQVAEVETASTSEPPPQTDNNTNVARAEQTFASQGNRTTVQLKSALSITGESVAFKNVNVFLHLSLSS